MVIPPYIRYECNKCDKKFITESETIMEEAITLSGNLIRARIHKDCGGQLFKKELFGRIY